MTIVDERENTMGPIPDSTEAAWQGVAAELASALRATILRNPSVSAQDWDRAQAALGRYDRATGEKAAALPASVDE
ncbi:MAG TPA: hypothetical protein VGO87_07255 [Acidimicrobiia bacterium]|jgi:hypothetical protein